MTGGDSMIEILLVDDEAYVTNSLEKTIPWDSIGVKSVYQAASAFEALELLEENAIDIVVTDIAMPDMSGLELIREIGQRWPNVKCILLTGHSDFEYAKKAVQLQAFDYILKPVNDDEFMKTVAGAIEALKDEWEQADKYQQLLYDRKSDFTILRANFMVDLVLGRQLSPKTIREKLVQYEIPLAMDTPSVLMLVQLGKQFSHLDYASSSLMEFAVGNIAEETFAEHFKVWHCKAPHEYLLILAQPKPQLLGSGELNQESRMKRKEYLERSAATLRSNVSSFLRGEISLVVSEWFAFPDDVPAAYRATLGKMFLAANEEYHGIYYLSDEDKGGLHSVKAIESLYKPPTINVLLESKRWSAAEEKMRDVFADLRRTRYSREHLYEVYLAFTNAFMYVAHRQGKYVSQIKELDIPFILDQTVALSPDRLEDWSLSVLRKLEEELSGKEEGSKSYLIKQVQEMVTANLSQDTSVKSIADRVYLHPVYLSKVFKAETGESLSEWIISKKMERALYLLKSTNKKIYEITSELGYQNPQYFSKTFKKYVGLTPQEFREQ
jgi:two-component system response regulator YesN